jgi:hypothetical protein
MFELIQDLLLFEMAYQRKKAREIIGGTVNELANHMILLQHCPGSQCENGWKEEVNAFLSTIDDSTYLKKKHARIKLSTLIDDVWDGPMGEYEDYLRRYNKLKIAKPKLTLTVPSEEAWLDIRKKYMKAFDLILKKKTTPAYDALL